MLEFVCSEDGKELFVYLDEEGWAMLQREVEHARTGGHNHLWSSEWGGDRPELTVTPGSSGTFHKVTITFEQ